MKKVFYILFLLLGFTTLAQSVNIFTCADLYSYQETRVLAGKLSIIVNDRLINISNIQEGSYILVFDTSGRNIYKQIVKQGSISVPVRTGGVYIVRIQYKEDIFTQKVLVD